MTHFATVLTAAKTIDTCQRALPEQVPAGHLRLKLATASLCGTDLHYYKHFSNAGFQMQRPVSLGHEACAYVVDANGTDMAPGQLVALNPIIHCGTCAPCLQGLENHCQNKKFPGSATTVPHLDGFFQAEFDFPIASCHAVPAGTNPDHLTFAEPLACSMHSVTQTGAKSGDCILITGCGPMGLLAVVAAKSKGIEVHVSDVRPEAVTLACDIGASKGFVIGKDTPAPLSYDAVIEASGSPHAFNTALDVVKKRGVVSILSNIQLSETPVNLHMIMLKELNIAGSFQFNVEFRQAIDLILSGEQDFEQLIAARFALADTQAALDYMLAGKAAGKILIKPEL